MSERCYPTPSVSLLTSNEAYESVLISVHTNPGNKSVAPFPVVYIGAISWQPSRAQLVELRDKISAYLAPPDQQNVAEGEFVGLCSVCQRVHQPPACVVPEPAYEDNGEARRG